MLLFWNPHSAEDQVVHLSVGLIAGVHEIFESLSSNPKTSGAVKKSGYRCRRSPCSKPLQRGRVIRLVHAHRAGAADADGADRQLARPCHLDPRLHRNARDQPAHRRIAQRSRSRGQAGLTARREVARRAAGRNCGCAPYTRPVPTAEELAQHLRRPLGRGAPPAHAFTGAAGGAACGDLVRVSLALDAASRAGSPTPDLTRGAAARRSPPAAPPSGCCAGPRCWTPRASAPRRSPRSSAAEPAKRHAAELAADALHRALGQRGARPRAARAGAPRTLVAMSGGVDSAVAALLDRERGDEAVGVTLDSGRTRRTTAS